MFELLEEKNKGVICVSYEIFSIKHLFYLQEHQTSHFVQHVKPICVNLTSTIHQLLDVQWSKLTKCSSFKIYNAIHLDGGR